MRRTSRKTKVSVESLGTRQVPTMLVPTIPLPFGMVPPPIVQPVPPVVVDDPPPDPEPDPGPYPGPL